MKEQINKLALSSQDELVHLRRDFHRYAETAWTEFRTASIVAKYLEDLGYEIISGSDVMEGSCMMNLPSEKEMEQHMERAKAQGAHRSYLDEMKGGFTSIIGVLKTGKPGPVIAYRFDMDANELDESDSETHHPFKEGFASINPGAMHACGHDGHTAIGLGVAKLLMQIKDCLCGTIKLCFQAAEEGARGAERAIVKKGHFNDVDYIVATHLGFGVSSGKLSCSWEGLLASTKFDAVFTGTPAHAGARPEEGKSALLAAAAATVAVQGIYRHSEGNTRINIGMLHAGTGRNVVPPNAVMKLETRGETTELDAFMKSEAIRMIEASAKMYDVAVEIKIMGNTAIAVSDPEMVAVIKEAAIELDIFDEVLDSAFQTGGEDYCSMMKAVQAGGGKAGFFLTGTDFVAGAHTNTFDIDETVLSKGVAVFAMLAHHLGKNKLHR